MQIERNQEMEDGEGNKYLAAVARDGEYIVSIDERLLALTGNAEALLAEEMVACKAEMA